MTLILSRQRRPSREQRGAGTIGSIGDRNTRSAHGANLGLHPGGVAQLVERYVRNVEVGGSSPLTSTRPTREC